ncbi:MAG: FAD-dependent oxidoreductase, partial [Planctomycetota bacterium]
AVRPEGLRGAGCWPDGRMRCHQRIAMELLRWAATCGALCLNYVRAESLRVEGGAVTGLEVLDMRTGRPLTLRAERVLNTAGPGCRALASEWHKDVPDLFRPTVAFNLMLEADAPSDHAVAVAPPGPGARTFFVTPWHGRTFAGTYHTDDSATVERGAPSDELVARMLSDLRKAIPGWDVRPEHVVRVHAGKLPGELSGGEDMAHRAVRVDHGAQGGPRGLTTVSGVKYTTAGLEARRGLEVALGSSLPGMREDSARPAPAAEVSACETPSGFDVDLAVRLAGEEQAASLEDVVLRRADWGEDPASAASAMAQLRGRLSLPDRVEGSATMEASA